MSRWPLVSLPARSRSYAVAVGLIATIIVVQMVTSVVGAIVANRQFERASIDTFEYVGALTAERVARYSQAARNVTEATAAELEMRGADQDRDDLVRSLYERLVRSPGVRAVYVGWPDGEYLSLRRDREGFVAQHGGGSAQTVTSHYDAAFTLEARQANVSSYDPRERPWYVTGAESRETRWTAAYVEFFSDTTLVSAAHAAHDGDEVTAVVGADLNLDKLAELLDELPFGEGAQAFVFTRSLEVIAAPTSYRARLDSIAEGTGIVADASDLGLVVDPAPIMPGEARFGRQGERIVLDRGFPASELLPWRLHITASSEELSAGLGGLRGIMLWITGFSLVMVAVAGLVLWGVRHPLRKLRERAMTDPLTGLLNRREFFRNARAIATRATERGDVVMAMALDLDNFKGLNDDRGHVMGDKALAAVAAGLVNSAREGDLAGRMGGDEFAAIYVLRPGDEPQAIADRVREAIVSEIHATVDGAQRVGVTAGYATSESGVTDVSLLVLQADEALVAGKRLDKGRAYAAVGSARGLERRRSRPHGDDDSVSR